MPALSLGLTHLGSAGATGAFGVILTVFGALLLVAFAVDASGRGRSARRAMLLDISMFRRPRYATAQVTVLFTGLSGVGLAGMPAMTAAIRAAPDHLPDATAPR